MKNPCLYIASEHSDNDRLVIATLISTRGSTPQKPGSSAIFDSKGLVYGTIGGGVLEGRVTEIAMKASGSGESGIYHFDLDKDIVNSDEAICGGTADVAIDARPADHLAIFRDAERLLTTRTPCVIVTILSEAGDGSLTIERYVYSSGSSGEIPLGLAPGIIENADKLLSDNIQDACKLIITEPAEEGHKKMIFLEPLFPVSRLVIAGAGHIGKALCHLGSRLDFEVTVVDNRPEYANSENLPEADSIVVGNIGEVLGEIEKDSNTYIVIVTRGHSDDSEALRACINSNAKYIGMIGSRTKIEKMHRNFIENKWAGEDEWSAVHAPIGLDIKSQSVEEIAISIAGQLVLERNKAT